MEGVVVKLPLMRYIEMSAYVEGYIVLPSA